MAIQDKDFIERQVETTAKGLAKFLDLAEIEALFHKKEDEQGAENNEAESQEA